MKKLLGFWLAVIYCVHKEGHRSLMVTVARLASDIYKKPEFALVGTHIVICVLTTPKSGIWIALGGETGMQVVMMSKECIK